LGWCEFHAVEPFGAIAAARRDSVIWSAALPPLYRAGGFEAPEIDGNTLLTMFGVGLEPEAEPQPLTLEEERRQLNEGSQAFAFLMSRAN